MGEGQGQIIKDPPPPLVVFFKNDLFARALAKKYLFYFSQFYNFHPVTASRDTPKRTKFSPTLDLGPPGPPARHDTVTTFVT